MVTPIGISTPVHRYTTTDFATKSKNIALNVKSLYNHILEMLKEDKGHKVHHRRYNIHEHNHPGMKGLLARS